MHLHDAEAARRTGRGHWPHGRALDRFWTMSWIISRRLLGTVVGGIRREIRRQSVERALDKLDDRTLRDIGIHRSEIGAIARRYAFEDPPPEPRRRQTGPS
jgi:uncharacterized protein YjiS (DUF1127 family)